MNGIKEILFNELDRQLTLSQLEANLNRFLKYPCRIEYDENITLIEERVLVDKINNVKIIIRFDEHPPPHFHIKFNNSDVSFSIVDCMLIKGYISSRIERKIKYWYENGGKKRLIDIWNTTRPTNCEVGIINET